MNSNEQLDELLRNQAARWDERAPRVPTLNVQGILAAKRHTSRNYLLIAAAVVAVAAVAAIPQLTRRSPSASPAVTISSGASSTVGLDVTVVVTYAIGPGPNAGISPADVAARTGSLACQSWVLNPLSQGGTAYEIHLRVSRAGADRAAVAAMTLLKGSSVVIKGLSAFSSPPPPYVVPSSDSGAGTVVRPLSSGC
jgi:hypothetical protein